MSWWGKKKKRREKSGIFNLFFIPLIKMLRPGTLQCYIKHTLTQWPMKDLWFYENQQLSARSWNTGRGSGISLQKTIRAHLLVRSCCGAVAAGYQAWAGTAPSLPNWLPTPQLPWKVLWGKPCQACGGICILKEQGFVSEHKKVQNTLPSSQELSRSDGPLLKLFCTPPAEKSDGFT